MAGIIILGIAAAVEAVHGEIEDRRSPLICLNMESNALSTSPTASSSLTGRTAPKMTALGPKDAFISKRGLKKLAVDWDLRAGELGWRIREIERHHRVQGVEKCWAGSVKDLLAMRDCLLEAREIRHRLVEALLYVRALPDPLKKASLNPVHRRPKDVLPVTSLPPSLNGLPVPLPKPPKSGQWRLVLDRVLPGYDEAGGSAAAMRTEDGAYEAMLRTIRSGRPAGVGSEGMIMGDVDGAVMYHPPSYDDATSTRL